MNTKSLLDQLLRSGSEMLQGKSSGSSGYGQSTSGNSNYGQHMAIMAAFERVRGEVIVTLDADLQNPPEEIPKLLAKMDAGHDYVGGYRLNRQDSWFRTYASKLINFVREQTTSIEMTDQGCMLRAYRRPIIEAIVRSGAGQWLRVGHSSSLSATIPLTGMP